jgi:hypothetical protein
MRQKPGLGKEPAETVGKGIRRTTRSWFYLLTVLDDVSPTSSPESCVPRKGG